jgi:molybdopterin molybdotransferase
MLAAFAREFGISLPQRLTAADNLNATLQALESCAAADIIVLSGGVSVGTYDFVPRALDKFGAKTVFHGVSQKPGKPLLFARRANQLIFGLPGNPLACHICFHRYVAAAIRKLSGRRAHPLLCHAELGSPIATKGGRVNYIPARWMGWNVELLANTSSADIFQSCGANCYVELPAITRTCESGEMVQFTWIVEGKQ